MILMASLVISVLCFSTLFFVRAPAIGEAGTTLPIPIQSALTADYSREQQREVIAPVRIEVLRALFEDEGLTDADVDDRFETIEEALLTPVPTVTPTSGIRRNLTPSASPTPSLTHPTELGNARVSALSMSKAKWTPSRPRRRSGT